MSLTSRPPWRHAAAQLPLTPIEFEVLLALHEHDLHGYGLAKAVEQRTAGRLRLEPANLYRRLHKLVQQGLVAAADRRAARDAGNERRQYFRITDFGRQVLQTEALRLQDQVRAAAARRVLAHPRRSR
ncbi:MAG TPA: PadR family transcriptional regulator [Vicinamibacterales bacterium]|nr:PadR family transcriptional regulator [Vicinamibacterales bacterium]